MPTTIRSKVVDGSLSLPPAGETLVDLLRGRALALGDREAFCYLPGDGAAETAITYRSLHERAMAIAAELQGRAEPGSRALLLFPPGLEFIEGFFGCLYAGIVAVPIAPPGRNRFAWSAEPIFEASQPSVVLSTARHCEKAAQSYAPARLLDRPWIAVDQINGDAQHHWRDPHIDAEQTAFLQYTSGSTSDPKGVILSHRSLLYNAELIRDAFGNTPTSSAVFWLPLYHDMGLIGGVIQPLFCGGACTLLPPAAFLQRPVLWLETISRKRATVSGGPNFGFELCARKICAEDRQCLDLSSWEVAFVGAEPVRAQTLDRFSKAFAPCGFRPEALFPCYGLAEATLMVSGGPRGSAPTVISVRADALTCHEVQDAPGNDPVARSLVSCGENLPGQRILIVDPETRRPCRNGEVGEIWVQGPSVASGYYDRAEATTLAFRATLANTADGPFLRTGDLGFLRNGHLFVTGRLKDLIIIRGRNFYPEDIEHSVERVYDGLRLGYGAAFSVDGDNQERLVVVHEVEPRRRNLDTHRAMQAIRHAVAAEYGIEVYAIALVKAGMLAKTSSGKTRRSACRERYLKGEMEVIAEWKADLEGADEETADEPVQPSPRPVTAGEVEAWLTQRIAARLRLPRAQVQATTPFTEFGMSSVDATEIAAGLERWLGRSLSPTAIYNYPTISALARWLASPATDSRSAATGPAAQPSGEHLDPDQLDREVQRMTGEEQEQFMLMLEEIARQERE